MKQYFNPLLYFPKHRISQVILLLIPVCLLTLCFLYGCKKNTTELPPYTSTTSSTWAIPPCDTCLPPITNEGKNTFGCKINGKSWLPKDGYMRPGLRLDLWNHTISLIAENHKSIDGVTINVNPIVDTGYFSFPSSQLDLIRAMYDKDNKFEFITDPLTIGYIYFTKVDYQKGIFSGTFAFDLYNNEGDTMHITEGRFDVRK